MSLLAKLFWAMIFFSPAVYLASHGEYLIAAAVAAGGLSAFVGFRLGLTTLLWWCVAGVLCYVYGMQGATALEPHAEKYLGLTGIVGRVASISVVFVLFHLLTLLIGGRMTRAFLFWRPRLERGNQVSGFVAGFLQGACTVLLVAAGVSAIAPGIENQLEQSGVEVADAAAQQQVLLAVADATETSAAAPYLEEFDLFESWALPEKMETFQRVTKTLQDPVAVQQAMRHPAIVELRQDESVQQAMQELREDPEMAPWLSGDTSAGKAALMRALEHPAILRLIDTPEFRTRAAAAIGAIQ
ncbi:MAG: CvpA family protein [Planctomycetota bacterium]